MALAQMFDNGSAGALLSEEFAHFTAPAPSDEMNIPVLPELAGLLPAGLRRGEAVALGTAGRDPDYLCLALLAGALANGLWCAAVGVPELGVAAVAGLAGAGAAGRAALDRLLLVPEPGERWAEVLTILADGVDLVLVRPPRDLRAETGRRIDARLRQRHAAGDPRGSRDGAAHRAGLLVLGPWSSARLVLRTERTIWTGVDPADGEPGPQTGVGRLTGGRATVVAEGRATAGRPRTVRLWLPGPQGAAGALSDPALRPYPAPPADVPGDPDGPSRQLTAA
jgi:hypothetical protein